MSNKKGKRYQFWKAPIRFLIKIKNFYMKSMIFCDGQVGGYGNYIAGPMPQTTTLPKSFSVSSSRSGNDDEEFRELMKAASTRRLELDVVQRRQQRAAGSNDVTRSRSAGIESIDEDKSCDFGEVVSVKADLYPRSKSHAVSSSRKKSLSLV